MQDTRKTIMLLCGGFSFYNRRKICYNKIQSNPNRSLIRNKIKRVIYMNERDFFNKISDMNGKAFIVGGFVRDLQLGLAPHDKDYVVEGVYEERFKQAFPAVEKTGKDFPVFRVLIDDVPCEVAFARKEKKIGVGTNGFSMVTENVTIENDLYRRDLTINAIAMTESGDIVDPFGGVHDINNKVIKHVSDHFVEDPLRVYRVARFCAKFSDFTVAESTKNLLSSMKEEIKFLTQERVELETEKILTTQKPSKAFELLAECGLLDVHFGNKNNFDLLKRVEQQTNDTTLRFVALMLDVKGDANNFKIRAWKQALHNAQKLLNQPNTMLEKLLWLDKVDRLGLGQEAFLLFDHDQENLALWNRVKSVKGEEFAKGKDFPVELAQKRAKILLP